MISVLFGPAHHPRTRIDSAHRWRPFTTFELRNGLRRRPCGPAHFWALSLRFTEIDLPTRPTKKPASPPTTSMGTLCATKASPGPPTIGFGCFVPENLFMWLAIVAITIQAMPTPENVARIANKTIETTELGGKLGGRTSSDGSRTGCRSISQTTVLSGYSLPQ